MLCSEARSDSKATCACHSIAWLCASEDLRFCWAKDFHFCLKCFFSLHIFCSLCDAIILRSFFLLTLLCFACAYASPLCNWIWFCKQKHGSLNANIFALIFHQHQQQQHQCECMHEKRERRQKKGKNIIIRQLLCFALVLLCFALKLESWNERTDCNGTEEKRRRKRKSALKHFFFTLFVVFAHASKWALFWDYLQWWWFR